MRAMHDLLLFFHLAAAIFWMGGMAFMVLALRPALGVLEPPHRLTVVHGVLSRFFVVVAVSIAVLLASGLALFAGQATPARGWQAMAVLGLAMMLIFGHIWFSPWRRFKLAVAAANWPEAGQRAGQITMLAQVNLGLGWLAIAAVKLWH